MSWRPSGPSPTCFNGAQKRCWPSIAFAWVWTLWSLSGDVQITGLNAIQLDIDLLSLNRTRGLYRPIFKSVSRSTTSDGATAAAVAFPRPNPYIGYVSCLVSWHRVRLRYITKIGTAPIRRVSAWMDVRFVSQSRFVSSGVFHFRRAGVCVITACWVTIRPTGWSKKWRTFGIWVSLPH